MFFKHFAVDKKRPVYFNSRNKNNNLFVETTDDGSAFIAPL